MEKTSETLFKEYRVTQAQYEAMKQTRKDLYKAREVAYRNIYNAMPGEPADRRVAARVGVGAFDRAITEVESAIELLKEQADTIWMQAQLADSREIEASHKEH